MKNEITIQVLQKIITAWGLIYFISKCLLLSCLTKKRPQKLCALLNEKKLKQHHKNILA